MTKKGKSRFEEAAQEIDLRLDGLFGQLGSALTEALSRLEDQGEVHHETTLNSARGPVRASAGIRISTIGDKARARRPDKPINTPRPEARPIQATILKDAGRWQLIAELPGVAEADVTLAQEGAELVITATARGRHYEGRFALPEGADAANLSKTMQNGILDLTWEAPE